MKPATPYEIWQNLNASPTVTACMNLLKATVSQESPPHQEAPMVRNWTKIGAELAGNLLEGGERSIDRQAVENAIESIEWREIPKEGKLEAPFMPGEGIKAAIQQLHIPKVSHVAWSNELAPYGFYGVRGYYKNGQAEIYLVDTGCNIVPVCSDFHGAQP